MKYVALLRGINVGGNSMVKMEELRKMLEEMGFTDVRTLLTSGNVVFATGINNTDGLRETIEKTLSKTFSFEISVLLRTGDEIAKLVESGPFKGIIVTPQTRLYVTFLSDKPQSTLRIPYESPEKDFKILRVTDQEICSVLTLSEKRNTIDAMGILEKEFGKKVTTRNWNTIIKIAAI